MQNLKVKTLVLIFLGVMVVGGLGYGGYRLWNKEKPKENGNTNQSTQSATTQYTWQTYRNDEFGISFEYPNNLANSEVVWEVTETKQSRRGMYDFDSPENLYNFGVRDIDTNIDFHIAKKGIADPMLDETNCLCSPNNTGQASTPEKNLVIGGVEGYMVRRNYIPLDNSNYAPSYITCFVHNDLFLEIQYFPNVSSTQVAVFMHLLETFTFDDLERRTNIPDLNSL